MNLMKSRKNWIQKKKQRLLPFKKMMKTMMIAEVLTRILRNGNLQLLENLKTEAQVMISNSQKLYLKKLRKSPVMNYAASIF
jgi:hypothetical protein